MSYFQTIYAAELPHRAVAVYMYLRDRSNGEGACWPSHEEPLLPLMEGAALRRQRR